MKILIIEDDPHISRSLASFLKSQSIVFDIAVDGERGLFLARVNNYDLILLDYNLPKLSGKEIITKIRTEGQMTPIIMLTVRGELEDKINILEIGADDYLIKPFSLTELLARIKAVLRRPAKLETKKLICKNLELDATCFKVTRNGRSIPLRTKEFTLLEYLLRNKGSVISRQEIMEHVWDENADPFSNTIEVHMMNLRRKIETKKERFIFTIPNRGYKIDEKV
jgi:DNA-binding response OmpR family regulator